MAKKKASKAPTKTVPSLKPHLARSLKQAKALRRKVTNPDELETLISNLESLQKSAESSCPTSSWGRKFMLSAKAAPRKRSPKR